MPSNSRADSPWICLARVWACYCTCPTYSRWLKCANDVQLVTLAVFSLWYMAVIQLQEEAFGNIWGFVLYSGRRSRAVRHLQLPLNHLFTCYFPRSEPFLLQCPTQGRCVHGCINWQGVSSPLLIVIYSKHALFKCWLENKNNFIAFLLIISNQQQSAAEKD